jgi:hypothetical protein
MNLIAFIKFLIVCFTIQISNNVEWLKAKIKLRILVWKADRNKISKDEFIKLGQILVNEYRIWQVKSMERINKATRNLENSFKGE